MMQKRAGGIRGGRVGLIAAIAAVLCLGVAAMAIANNLDRRTATKAAKQIAKQECQRTHGLHGLLRPPSAPGQPPQGDRQDRRRGGARQGRSGFACVRQIVIKLDHVTGDDQLRRPRGGAATTF